MAVVIPFIIGEQGDSVKVSLDLDHGGYSSIAARERKWSIGVSAILRNSQSLAFVVLYYRSHLALVPLGDGLCREAMCCRLCIAVRWGQQLPGRVTFNYR